MDDLGEGDEVIDIAQVKAHFFGIYGLGAPHTGAAHDSVATAGQMDRTAGH
jgi:hypothetical protein